MHSVTSSKPVRVLLIYGSSEAGEDLRPVLAVHGFMMFLAWGMFLPGGILATRYMKHVNGDVWFKIHVYSQWSGLTITFLGILFAAAELRGLHIDLLHVKVGIFTVILGCIQPINAYLRPNKGDSGEEPLPQRIVWEYIHAYCGRLAVFVGFFAIFSGMKHLGDRYEDENARGLLRVLKRRHFVGQKLLSCLQSREAGSRIQMKFNHLKSVLLRDYVNPGSGKLKTARIWIIEAPMGSLTEVSSLNLQLNPAQGNNALKRYREGIIPVSALLFIAGGVYYDVPVF
ncbi:hypothetical protein L1987_86940 [Smallanthus sonchifolius]|uniref:Uncharacterized protein n=1 Tax=Smallanthus sonchifolius TaxID=185202 RepID=A0ACB8Y4Z1_9ASTR|nr:hypothetical protein L1987_86940 [Smallanthus sonchifolius]